MKTTTIIIRILLGALLLFGSIPYFLNLFPQPELRGNMRTFNEGLKSAIYLLPLIKSVELLCGISFIINQFVPLANVIIFPVILNILGVHVFLAPQGIPMAIFMFLSNLFLAYRYKEHYRAIFYRKVGDF